MINSPVRKLMGRVEVYNGSTLTLICGCHDRLKEFTVERMGESKFFGYGICHKLNVKLLDKDRELNISTANSLEVEFGIETDYLYPFPKFHVSQVYRDELTNELSITAYDALYGAANHTVAELGLSSPYTIGQFTLACGALLGLPVDLGGLSEFDREYITGANFEGTETIREALNAIAEATQSIYFINWDWKLCFRRLSNSAAQALLIDKNKYFTLDSGENRRLAKIVHATELGDNVSSAISATGTTQFVRNNPFWDLREDIDSIVDSAISAVGGLTINQFSCEWRGNILLEIGDRIGLTAKDGSIVSSFLLSDTLTFNGSLSQSTGWQYEDNEEETADNPSSLGDALRQTFARVDKANKEIALVVSDVNSNKETVSQLQLTTEGLNTTVQKIETDISTSIGELNDDVASLTSKVEASITSEDVALQISTELANGVDKVITTTGFTFNEQGLTVSKSGTEMTTTITEDGMKVFRDTEQVLTADNEGVKAEDLHATTYLIIGANSRLEDYGSGRTGCFWIGG
jgi:hypothetical protein